MTVKTPIIPVKQLFAKREGSGELNYKAICVFSAIGFFLDQDTYYTNEVVLRPASNIILDDNNVVKQSLPYFNWFYSPRGITFNEALEEFTSLFEQIVAEQIRDQNVILPLSGGLDSRTQASALKALKANVFSYSYDFKHGYKEAKIARAIAKQCNFPFEAYSIKSGYLWGVIEKLTELNKCYSDFTSPRQMAVIDQLSDKGDMFSLGHWGDVLFDSMNLPQLSFEEEIDVLVKKLLKRGGLEFATSLWKSWELEGQFIDYFRARVSTLLSNIKIEDTNARLRAFKSMYWAPRWTSANLSIFSQLKPIELPYYDNRMCEFICTVPEDYLKDRKLQIAYIKQRSPELAKITWQDKRPFNLNTYRYNKLPYNLPYKIANKLKREINAALGKSYVQRNWELQFYGQQNDEQLRHFLFNSNLNEFVDEKIIHDNYFSFKNEDALQYAQAVNMLLVLSQFNRAQSV